ncbi:hypothetical protein P9112_012664 [Eukaryota sp. TZLM1-RC]
MPSSSSSKRIGSYVLGPKLGEGTFGCVRKAVHQPTNSKVAIKFLEKSKIVDKADVKRITREIHILHSLSHPHVVRLLEVIDSTSHLYLVTEYCSGGELFDYIAIKRRLDEAEACKLFRQLVEGVDYCHRKKVYHRDLNLENVLVDSERNIRIINFGLSNSINTINGNEMLKTACGSPCYASPEMIAGSRHHGKSIDIWSCGIILFSMLCGYLPFENPSIPNLYSKILSGTFTIPSFVSSEASDLIRKLLTVDPQRRCTIDGIRNHPWLNKFNQVFVPQEDDPDEVLDEDILRELTSIGIDSEHVVSSLESKQFNSATTAYMLLSAKKRKGQSISLSKVK